MTTEAPIPFETSEAPLSNRVRSMIADAGANGSPRDLLGKFAVIGLDVTGVPFALGSSDTLEEAVALLRTKREEDLGRLTPEEREFETEEGGSSLRGSYFVFTRDGLLVDFSRPRFAEAG